MIVRVRTTRTHMHGTTKLEFIPYRQENMHGTGGHFISFSSYLEPSWVMDDGSLCFKPLHWYHQIENRNYRNSSNRRCFLRFLLPCSNSSIHSVPSISSFCVYVCRLCQNHNTSIIQARTHSVGAVVVYFLCCDIVLAVKNLFANFSNKKAWTIMCTGFSGTNNKALCICQWLL